MKKTPSCLKKQANDYVGQISGATLEYAEIVDIDTIRIWFRNSEGKLIANLQRWIKNGAVTLPQNHDYNQSLLPIRYVPGDSAEIANSNNSNTDNHFKYYPSYIYLNGKKTIEV